jgi:hypothetical protein
MNTQNNLLPRLQALLARWDEQAATAARKLVRSENPTAGAFYSGAMFGYEDCADDLAMLLKEVLANTIEPTTS